MTAVPEEVRWGLLGPVARGPRNCPALPLPRGPSLGQGATSATGSQQTHQLCLCPQLQHCSQTSTITSLQQPQPASKSPDCQPCHQCKHQHVLHEPSFPAFHTLRRQGHQQRRQEPAVWQHAARQAVLYLREMRPRKKHTEADLVTATGAARMSRGKDVQTCAACCPAGWIWHAVHVHNSMHQTQCCTLATTDSQTTTTRNANRRCNRQAVCNLKPPKHMTSATKKAAHETSSLASACLPVAEAQGDCQECHEPHPRARIPPSHIKCRHKHCP